MTYQEAIRQLEQLKSEEKAAYRTKKFGIVASNYYGISNADLKVLAKKIGHNKALALQLFDSGIYEGKLICSKILKPKDVTDELSEKWVKSFDNWEICDSFCMALVAKSELALPKIKTWSQREAEFEKRGAFATMAAYCMADKKSENKLFHSFFPLILAAATDDRLYVKKAVNWALRSIGKRNQDLRKSAIETAKNILEIQSKAAQWIAKGALKELENENVRMSDYPRKIYRPE